jgi:hypothetical protein
MNSLYSRTPGVSPTGIATASILLVTLIMAASLVLDPEANAFHRTTVVQTTTHAKG